MQNKIEGFRLSRQQRLLWQLHQESTRYHAQLAMRIDGNLDAGVLQNVIQKIVNQHQILRTTYHRLPGMKTPVQVVEEQNRLDWYEVDMRDLVPEQQQTRIETLLEAEAETLFDVEKGPLLHVILINLATDSYMLVITLPSLYADSWTLKNLVQEIGDRYAAEIQATEAFVDEDPADDCVQYIQFSEWQHALMESEDAENGIAYWQELTQSLPTLPALPFEQSLAKQAGTDSNGAANIELDARENGTQARRASWRLTLDPAVVANIADVSQRFDTTPETVLLTCWQILLWRFMGNSDIVVSNIYDGRSVEMLEEAFGLFAQSLPVLAHLEGNQPFNELLAQIDESVLDGYEWQDYFAWEDRADLSVNGADPARNDADRTIGTEGHIGFEFTEWPATQYANGVAFSVVKQQSFVSPTKLHLSCIQTDDTISVTVAYDPERFLAEGIQRLAAHYETLVATAAQNPTAQINALDILSESDRQQLLVDFNQTAASYPDKECIHQLFEEQVMRSPDQPAVVFAGQQLSYAELNARANQLAHYLRRLGVGPDVRVGLCIDRSIDMLVGILGILKAGGAYVPLNAEHPPARLLHQLAETTAPVLLTQERYLDQLPDFDGRILCLDRSTEWADEPQTNPENITFPHHLVYVIYTSGSTGTPKGVAVTHGNLVNYAHFIRQRLRLSEEVGLHFALVTTITADLGNTSLFPSLIGGGCLHILGYDVATDGAQFADYVQQNPIDVLKIVPSHLGALLASQPEGVNILPRKYLLLGGETFSLNLLNRIVATANGCEIINHYGPSETTVGSLTGTVNLNDLAQWPTATVPIGRPIANTQIYILDEHQQPVPIGLPGELYIGGAGVAQGYLNRPDLTAERFIDVDDLRLRAHEVGASAIAEKTSDEESPQSKIVDRKLYRTGDLVRYLPDGRVEFMGRADNQIKVRGFRVELDEIETIISRHPSVHQTVVLAREDEHSTGENNLRLIAYIVADEGNTPTNADLKTYLWDELPDYMIPAAFVMLDALPPNAKR